MEYHLLKVFSFAIFQQLGSKIFVDGGYRISSSREILGRCRWAVLSPEGRSSYFGPDIHGQVGRVKNRFILGSRQGALKGIEEFADVSGPFVFLKNIEEFG